MTGGVSGSVRIFFDFGSLECPSCCSSLPEHEIRVPAKKKLVATTNSRRLHDSNCVLRLFIVCRCSVATSPVCENGIVDGD